MDVMSYISQQCILESKGFSKQHSVTDLGSLAKFFFFRPTDQPTLMREKEMENKTFYGDGHTYEVLRLRTLVKKAHKIVLP